MAFCKYCGNRVAEKDIFCPCCGRNMTVSIPVGQPTVHTLSRRAYFFTYGSPAAKRQITASWILFAVVALLWVLDFVNNGITLLILFNKFHEDFPLLWVFTAILKSTVNWDTLSLLLIFGACYSKWHGLIYPVFLIDIYYIVIFLQRQYYYWVYSCLYAFHLMLTIAILILALCLNKEYRKYCSYICSTFG